MIFSHTDPDRGMWRGWFSDGQVMEISVVAYLALARVLCITLATARAERFLWSGIGFIQFFRTIGLAPVACLGVRRRA